jgi:hypothetical protein
MSNILADVLRVCDTEANLLTNLREKMFGFSTDTHRILVKAPGGTFYKYEINWVRDSANGYLYQSTLTDKIGIGTATPGYTLEVLGNINNINVSGDNPRGILSTQVSADESSAHFGGLKARGTPASPTIVHESDYVTMLIAYPYDGSQYLINAQAGYQVTPGSTPASGNVPVDFIISTGAVYGHGTVQLRIGSTGQASFTGGINVNGTDAYGTFYVNAFSSTNAARLRNNDASGFATLDLANAASGGIGISSVADLNNFSGNIKTKSLTGNGTQTVDVISLGTEIIGNVDFASDTWWYKTGGSTISGGVGNMPNGGSINTSPALTLEDDTVYKLVFTVTAQTVHLQIIPEIAGSGSAYIDESLTSGTYTRYFTTTETGNVVFFENQTAETTAQIDNVSLKKVSNATITPTNLSVELTNIGAYPTPSVTIASGSLGSNSLVSINNIHATITVAINSDGPVCNLNALTGIWYNKSSVGWLPTVGYLQPD